MVVGEKRVVRDIYPYVETEMSVVGKIATIKGS